MKPLSREQLLKKGRCCQHGCKNCPYADSNQNKRNEKVLNNKVGN